MGANLEEVVDGGRGHRVPVSSNPFSPSDAQDAIQEVKITEGKETPTPPRHSRTISFAGIPNHDKISVHRLRFSPRSSVSHSVSPDSSTNDNMITIALNKCKSKRVILNVGGEKSEVMWSTLEKFSDTRLGKLRFCTSKDELQELCDDYSLENNEFYFDRNPKTFYSILNFYRNGRLHIPHDFCIVEFSNEMNYWEVDEMNLDACCHLKYQIKKDQLYHDNRIKKSVELGHDPLELFEDEVFDLEEFGSGCTAKYRKYIWDLFERHAYWPSKVMSAISVFFIVLSISTFVMSTMKMFQDVSCKHINKTACAGQLATLISAGTENPFDYQEFIWTKSFIIVKVEQVTMFFFTLEYVLRLLCAPYKLKFLVSWLNIIDILAILPYYLSQILFYFNANVKDLQVLLIFRVFRIFKLARHSTGLQSLGYTFRRSYQDLGVLLMFLTVGVVVSSSLAYFAEREVNKSFSSIPAAFWWALITMTTVGYGDATPITVLGKFVGGMTAIVGVVIVALPIAFTMNTFGEFYEKQRQREKLMRRRRSSRWSSKN